MAPPTLQTSVSALSISSPIEKAADISEQKEIDTIWKEVYNKVVELAGGDPRRVQGTLDINAVLKYVDDVQASSKKKSEKFGTFRNIVNRTLQCINTVGGIVADGASTVFAPAGMCYNALTFVIQAWQGYEGIFDNLAELLEKCTEFLERLESYQGKMDKRLARVAVQNLRLFVEICDRTIKLRKKHNKLFAFTKQLFLNDNGIQDLLSYMDRLNSKEALLVNAQTYKIVSDSAGDIKLILDGQKEQKKEQELKKWRAAIAKALGFPSTSLDKDEEPIPSWQKTFDARKNMLVDDTGKWILEDQAFLEWTDSKSFKKPVMVLGGRNGSGKTSAMANTMKYLRKISQVGPASRIVTPYFFVDVDKKKSDDEDTSTVLELVSRALLWQISIAYEAMTKSVYQILERTPEFDGSLDLWQQLFINNKERMNPDTAFVLFIDNFDETLIPLLEKLTSGVIGRKTRVFLTARPQMFSEWLEKEKGIGFNMIPISEHNSDDIDKYIASRMDSMPILKDPGRPGIPEWREKILRTLRFKCAGDYFKLNSSLDALAKVDLIDDINEVLAKADRTRVDQIDAELQRLNNSRTIKEIQEINEIILWIETGRRWLTINMMEDLLSVKYRNSSVAQLPNPIIPLTRRKTDSPNIESIAQEATPKTLTISLLPFAQKLAEKYPIFAVKDSGYIDWRSPEIKDRIKSKGSDPDAVMDVAASGPQIIQESEIAIVKHFLNNVCPPELYERLEFEHFFRKKLGAKHREYICLDPDNADIKAAIACLTILTEEELRNNRSLRQYGRNWLLDHLKEVDLSAADRDLKAQVGPLLVKLFTEECGIDSLFWPFELGVSKQTWEDGENMDIRYTRIEWVYSTAGVQEVSRWLHDSSVTKRITSDHPGASFVAEVKSSANLHKTVLSYAAKHLADHLFLRVEFLNRHFRCASCFIRGYLSRLDRERASQMPNDPSVYTEESDAHILDEFESAQFTIEEVNEIEAFATEVLQKSNDTPEKESSWETHGALIVFQLCASEASAIEIYQSRARKAVDLNPRNWHAVHFIAKQPNTGDEEAVQLLSQAKQEIDNIRARDPEWIMDHSNSALLARITLDLGDRLWDLSRDYQLAARTHRESLEYGYVRFMDYTEVLTRYQKHGAFSEFIAFIETLNKTSETWAEYFDELVYAFVYELTTYSDPNKLSQAADETNRWDVIEAFFTLALDMGVKRENHDLLFLLRHGFAKTLANAADGLQEDKVVAIQEKALEDVKLHSSDALSRYDIDDMANSLAESYLRKAFQPGLVVDKVDFYGSRIADLLPDVTNETLNIWGSNVNICCLIRYHHKRKSGSKLAKEWTQRIVRTSIELLSDEDEENDEMAHWLLDRLLTTIEDTRRVRILWHLRNLAQHEALVKWQDWTANPANTPKATVTNGNSTSAAIDGVIKGSENGSKSQPGEGPSNVVLEPPTPSKATNDNAAAPEKPSWFVSCDGCDKQWTVVNEPLYTCADCLGQIQLDSECYELHKKGELKKKGLKCTKEHAFVEVSAFDASLYKDIPKASVPLPDAKPGEKRWMSLDEWKDELRKVYLNGDTVEVSVQTPEVVA
ncbi:uncharacterized protein F4817DRAFT_33587 [Daldinia loculata]|uniref:uncharacterized protein n=1 Tax=Daldinia loculata TaxID=103429 RepID=UPI0020C3D6A4|nr:uncharacterized protein F4817DRAFT_33587 [Daldinia loculata]KAI1649310.1 hypothetical protein F4817DRAFT_33587 [Daldinia loculata]